MLLVCVEESVSLPTCPEHYYSLPVTVDLYTLLVIILLTMLQEAVGDTLEELWISYNNVEKLKGVTVLSKLKVSCSVCSISCSRLSLVPMPRGRSGNEAIHDLALYPEEMNLGMRLCTTLVLCIVIYWIPCQHFAPHLGSGLYQVANKLHYYYWMKCMT